MARPRVARQSSKTTNVRCSPFWIGMEGAIRTDDVFDASKCRQVCVIVFR
jgi:hypothetical protein